MSEDDRPKKTWREIDQMRESKSRSPEPKKQTRESVVAQKQYKANLDRLFDSGEAPKLLGKKITTPASPETRIAKMKAVRDAIGRDEITKAVDHLLALGPLPTDEEILTQALEHRKEPQVQEVINLLLTWLERNKPKRQATLKARLAGLVSNADDQETKDLAQRALDKLETIPM
jgi:hypothetical protein